MDYREKVKQKVREIFKEANKEINEYKGKNKLAFVLKFFKEELLKSYDEIYFLIDALVRCEDKKKKRDDTP